MCGRLKLHMMIQQEAKLAKCRHMVAVQFWVWRNWGFIHKATVNSSKGLPVTWDKEVLEVSKSRVDTLSIPRAAFGWESEVYLFLARFADLDF